MTETPAEPLSATVYRLATFARHQPWCPEFKGPGDCTCGLYALLDSIVCTCGHKVSVHTDRDVSDVVGWPCSTCRSGRCRGFALQAATRESAHKPIGAGQSCPYEARFEEHMRVVHGIAATRESEGLDAELERLRGLSDAATPGPWRHPPQPWPDRAAMVMSVVDIAGRPVYGPRNWKESCTNLALSAAAVNYVRARLAAARLPVAEEKTT